MTASHRAVIIIPHYNDVARLHRCLTALVPLPQDVDCVVVDNGSTDDLHPIHTAFPTLRVLTETQKGAAQARNRGVAETTAPLLFFLDSDCVPAPDWLATALKAAGRADLVGGSVTVFDETPPPRTGAQGFETVFAFDNATYINRQGFSVTANLITRRDVFDATGPFRAGVSEDLEWCQRAREKGFSITYAPDLEVAHPSREDWASLRRKWHRLTVELYGVHLQSNKGRLSWALRAAAMPLSALAHVPKVIFHPELRNARERIATVGILFRLRLTRAVWMFRQALGLEI